MIKVYMFYLDGSLYAFTENKEIAESFKNARSKRFVCVKKKVDDDREYQFFRANNSKYMLFETPIECTNYGEKVCKEDAQSIIFMAITGEENAIFEDELARFDDRINRVALILRSDSNPLKDKYTEILTDLCGISYLELDLLDIFIDLFPKTFDVEVE